jgi:hypothetical protein
MGTRMQVLSFPGSYEDDLGVEPVIWRIGPSDRYGDTSDWFEIHTVVRGVPIWGMDFPGLGPDEPDAAGAERLSLGPADDLDNCRLRGDLPCAVVVNGQRRDSTVHFALDLRKREPVSRPENLQLSTVVDGVTYEVTDDWFEDGLRRLEDALPDGVQLAACVTCQYSGYALEGREVMGIRCHRGAKTQVLAARTKAEYRSVPVNEEVPDTYLCPEYERRLPGTGYRR